MYIRLHVKYPLFLPDFKFLDRFSENPQIKKITKIRAVADEETEVTKLRVAFLNFGDAPKKTFFIARH